jgi:hypothetical protein
LFAPLLGYFNYYEPPDEIKQSVKRWAKKEGDRVKRG